MARRPRPDLADKRQVLATLIATALDQGQFHDPKHKRFGQPWTNEAFAGFVHATESAVRSWHHPDNPIRPTNIVPLLEVFYGETEKFAEARETMLVAWRRAGGFFEDDPPRSTPRTIETRPFSEAIEIVDLSISQPTPDNSGNLIIPYTLRIHPDTTDRFADKEVEIGVTEPLVVIESEHWLPNQDSVFRDKKHRYTKSIALRGAVRITGPKDSQGRIDGAPLEDEPKVIMEPTTASGDGPIAFSVRVRRDGFKVTPCDGAEVSETQQAVLDAIFDQSFARDSRERLIVASATVLSRAPKGAA